MSTPARKLVYRVLCPFGGSGPGAFGVKRASVRVLGVEASFEIIGGIDIDNDACSDFVYLVEAPSLCMPIERMTPADLRLFAGERAPDMVLLSPPCIGASGLLSDEKSKTPKYRALNGLALTWMRLMLATWDEPPKIILFENVPRLKTRAAGMLGKIRGLLRRAGYVLHDGFHDCGELGGLAQHRRRFFMIARHQKQVAPLVYRPVKRRVRACGEVLGQLPMPGDAAAGPMHTLPRISLLNWARLALIPAGGDWRDLAGVLAENQERRSLFKRHAVEDWSEPVGTVSGDGSNAVANVADPRPFGNVDRVTPWSSPAPTVTGSPAPSSGGGAVADPRVQLGLPSCKEGAYHNNYRVEDWEKSAHTVTGATRPGSGAAAVADPRPMDWFRGVLGVMPFDKPAGVVTGTARVTTGNFSVADPRVGFAFDHGYAVLSWSEPSATVAAGSYPGQGAYSVADPRVERRTFSSIEDAFGVGGPFAKLDPKRPPATPPLILAKDGTWHRPLTTLELAALQDIPVVVRGAPLKLAGDSHRRWRKAIGNAIPPGAMQAAGEQILLCLVQADLGAFALSSAGGVWVLPDVEAVRA